MTEQTQNQKKWFLGLLTEKKLIPEKGVEIFFGKLRMDMTAGLTAVIRPNKPDVVLRASGRAMVYHGDFWGAPNICQMFQECSDEDVFQGKEVLYVKPKADSDESLFWVLVQDIEHFLGLIRTLTTVRVQTRLRLVSDCLLKPSLWETRFIGFEDELFDLYEKINQTKDHVRVQKWDWMGHDWVDFIDTQQLKVLNGASGSKEESVVFQEMPPAKSIIAQALEKAGAGEDWIPSTSSDTKVEEEQTEEKPATKKRVTPPAPRPKSKVAKPVVEKDDEKAA